ncbi:MbcA/ParS/Xre antitoxin family protein [Stutzerimonas tarimensis]|uniref:Antitoxin Xre-like helix-turn-helix domain-containing protein n=1 Tax=Stutzerimonas tarimensis TaxID=1507735 RepID=A0ABV7T3R3_9GAMM
MTAQIAMTNTPDAGKVALKFFFNVTDKWGCTPAQQRVLLGSVGTTTYHKYKRLEPVRLPHDTLERVSYVMGIHKALSIIFSNHPESAWGWIKRPNAAAPFNGRSALDYMLAGRVVDLADVRRYLDAQRGW